MKNIPIYTKTADYAREHGELDAYRASVRANKDCKDAVTDAIKHSYDGWRIDTKTALKELTEDFPIERIAIVTAVTIRSREWDGRISQENKDWAKTFPFPESFDEWGYDRNSSFILTDVHPGLINLFANAVRSELNLAKTAEKKPSLVAKLKQPLPPKTDKPDKNKEQER